MERQLAAQRKAYGLPEDAFTSKPEEDEFEGIWPENLDSVAVFLCCQTQWRRTFGPMGGMVWNGLDYTGVVTVIRMHGHRGERAREIFGDVQIMEAAALETLNEQKQ